MSQKGVKKSKRWCKSRSSWDVPIWEKWDDEEDKDKRVYMPRFKVSKEDMRYLSEAAKRHGWSRSCELENILVRVFSFSMLSTVVFPYKARISEGKQKKPFYKKGSSMNIPKLMVHPSFIRLLEKEAERREVKMSLVFQMIFVVYRQKFPIYLPKKREMTPFLKHKVLV